MTRHKHKRTHHPFDYYKPLRKGQPYRRIIASAVIEYYNGKPPREFSLHATKGYRSGRV